jgi:preprotein translocase subunit YajC
MGAQPGGGGEAGLLGSFAPFILIFVVFYFLLIRPQQKKAKTHREMLAALKKGDAVITAGGLYGRIVETRDDVIVVDLGETTVTMGRGYISGVPASGQNVPSSREPRRSAKAKPAKAAPAKAAKARVEEEPERDEQPEETNKTVDVVESPNKDDGPVVK